MADAKVRITAENATAAGLRSVEASLKGLERSGRTDSQLVRFRATPGEKVNITRPDQAASRGVTIAPVYNIDARGATTDLVRALPEILRRNNDGLKTDIISGLRRGKYAV